MKKFSEHSINFLVVHILKWDHFSEKLNHIFCKENKKFLEKSSLASIISPFSKLINEICFVIILWQIWVSVGLFYGLSCR